MGFIAGAGAAIAGTIGSITAGIGGAVATGLGAVGLDAGLAGTIGGIAGPAIFGAGTGAGLSALTGGNPLTGAITGGLSGGLIGGLGGAGGALTSALGGSQTAADALLGAGAGTVGSLATHQNPLTGALEGGVGGALTGALNSSANQGAAQGVINSGGAEYPNGQIIPPVPPQLDVNGQPIAGTGYDPTVSASSTNVPPGGLTTGGGSTGTAANAATGTGGGGGSGGISAVSLGLGALSALGAMLNKPKPITYSTPGPSSNANLGPTYNMPLNGGYAPGQNPNYPGTTPVNPNVPNYYRYGTMPEQTFFTGNSLQNYGFAKGGALSRDREFRTGSGNHRVRGPGTTTSDSIPSMLSDKEYVLDANDVKAIGGGSNERGAAWLDRNRKKLSKGSGPLHNAALNRGVSR
jgi:hypothetical protein